jgi:hypothetical protein
MDTTFKPGDVLKVVKIGMYLEEYWAMYYPGDPWSIGDLLLVMHNAPKFRCCKSCTPLEANQDECRCLFRGEIIYFNKRFISDNCTMINEEP